MTETIEFHLPDVGEGIAEAEVLAWFVEVGEAVTADQPMVQVETDKSIVEIPAPVDGILLEQCVPTGNIAKVEELLALIGEGAGDPRMMPSRPDAPEPLTNKSPSSDLPEPPIAVDESSTDAASAQRVTTAGSTKARTRPLASPRTRRLAAQRGLDLAEIVGTGPHGRILAADLDQPSRRQETGQDSHPANGTTSTPPRRAAVGRDDEIVELRGLRRAIARSMTEALTIPHVTEFREVDATNLLAARAALKPLFEAQGVRLSVFPLLLKAVMRALALQPSMNATFDAASETVTKHAGVHLGMATATGDGLIVPVIRDADLLNLTELATEVERLAERARSRTATPEELSGGSFTVTNFGSFGTWMGNPVIRPPEVGIAGFGRISEKVVAIDGQPVVRPVLPIVVATDHRINDGAHLADFVNAVADAVAQPLLLLS